MSISNEIEFRRMFAVQFMATRAALEYERRCSTGTHMMPEDMPIADADCLAQRAWEQTRNEGDTWVWNTLLPPERLGP